MKIRMKDVLRELDRRGNVRFAVGKYDVKDTYKYLKMAEEAIKKTEGWTKALRDRYNWITKRNIGFGEKQSLAKDLFEDSRYMIKEVEKVRDSAQMLEILFRYISEAEMRDRNNRNFK